MAEDKSVEVADRKLSDEKSIGAGAADATSAVIVTAEDLNDLGVVNASGHVQELHREFGLPSAISTAITAGNAWTALGGGIVVALYNGGPPGIIYGLCVSFAFILMIAACIAELTSSLPSSAGVYHWASLAAGQKWGRILGWYAGWWNFCAWIFGAASAFVVSSNLILAMWSIFHPEYAYQAWHTFILFLILCWSSCIFVACFNKLLPWLQQIGFITVTGGMIATALVCAIMPSKSGNGYATSEFVWKEWENATGYTSDGFVFVMGMLNGMFALCTPDCVTHIAEEIPNPRKNVPKVIGIQMLINFFTSLFYVIPLLYAITDMDTVQAVPYVHPLAEAYRQATGSRGGSVALLLVIFFPNMLAGQGVFITAGRLLWTLARDDATPFSNTLGKVSKRFVCPFNATIACGVVSTLLGLIYLGSATAFNAFVGSFVVLMTLSYVTCIGPHILNGRKYMLPGPFRMPDIVAYPVYGISTAFILSFAVIFSFPFSIPTTAATMNYTSLITGGITVLMTGWWLWKRNRGYRGPQALMESERRMSQAHRAGSIPWMQ